ncbi:hypothetical protein O3G_MSEX015199 [Manduca sexta]|uniref:Uncharacterized protein n=2 Tax=Manduca sexta TaxID=7130 RepID=A0A922D4M7_MANSE|nr:hypothetical protein O3G_MSEX015199 [Manduca sexta]KAG6465514.1 hypothetical protein O3G_MSEX015199 [Manduca sexta]
MQEVEYADERRNVTDILKETDVPNSTSFNDEGFTTRNLEDAALDSTKIQIIRKYNDTDTISRRKKRSEPLFDKPDTNQCLSQCVFANLQVVDSRGIPRETELWNLVQSAVTSQQSRAALRDQIRACFQELQSEAEDNGCSYSNKLERCLMLRFADRKMDEGNANEKKADQ